MPQFSSRISNLKPQNTSLKLNISYRYTVLVLLNYRERESSNRGFRLQRRSAARLGEEEASVGMERGVAASNKKEVQRRSGAAGLVDSEKRQAAGGRCGAHVHAHSRSPVLPTPCRNRHRGGSQSQA